MFLFLAKSQPRCSYKQGSKNMCRRYFCCYRWSNWTKGGEEKHRKGIVSTYRETLTHTETLITTAEVGMMVLPW